MGRRPRLRLLLPAAFLVLAGFAYAERAPDVRVAHKSHYAERFTKLPIGHSATDEPRTLISLSPDQVEPMLEGDKLNSQAEFEMTICLKPGPGSSQPCVGRMYGYSPHVTAQIFLSPSTRPDARGAIAVSKRESLTCSQQIPNRNRHCVLTVPAGRADLNRNCQHCFLNLVVSAWHPAAQHGQVVSMGSFDDDEHVEQNRAELSMVWLRDFERPKPKETRRLRMGRIPVVNEGREPTRHVIYSLPVRHPQAGDRYYVESHFVVGIDHLPYNAAIRNEILIGSKRTSIEPKGNYGVTGYPVVSPRNGWTCTRGDSGHESPCAMSKGGVVEFTEDSNKTYFINLAVGSEAQLLEGQHYRGSKAKLKPGYLRAFLYRR